MWANETSCPFHQLFRLKMKTLPTNITRKVVEGGRVGRRGRKGGREEGRKGEREYYYSSYGQIILARRLHTPTCTTPSHIIAIHCTAT